MGKPKAHILHDSWIMFKRSILITLRNPESLVQATVTPFFLMFLFGTVFANIIDLGDVNYIDFIIPGIILQTVAQASQYSAINVANDMTGGMIDRFRSMSIAKSAVLIGHAGASVVRNSITIIVIICTAFIIGFRPQSDFSNWLIIAGILILISIAMSLIAVLCGVVAKTVDGASGLMFPLFILPFLSSGFAPTDTMSKSIRWFAQSQPMTPIIDSLRALILNTSTGDTLWIALAWCAGIIVGAFVLAVWIYNRKLLHD
jgi:ABC-2 type transport system permease protein